MHTRIFTGHDLAASILDTLNPRPGDGLCVLADPTAAGAMAYADRILTLAQRIGLPVEITDYPRSAQAEATLIAAHDRPILPLLPTPAGFDMRRFLDKLGPRRDVEGLHPESAGRLVLGRPDITPPTAEAATLVAAHLAGSLQGAVVSVIGASASVGRPLALSLLAQGATVRVAQETVKDLPAETRDADIVCAAAGVPGLVKRDHLRKGAIAIDIGVTRVGDRLIGDIDPDAARGHVAWLTAVPDGVGPVTAACLLRNVLRLGR